MSPVINTRCLTLLASTTILTSPLSAAPKPPPNIIYILADDLGYNELGCYGQTKIQTPNIDALAQNGMRFTQHYSGQAVCAPSRCVLLTGKHTGRATIRDNKEMQPDGQQPMLESDFTVAELLKKQQYATACIGKWGLGMPGTSGDPNQQGFDLFFGYNCQRQAHFYYPKYLWRNDQKVPYPQNKPRQGGPDFAPDRMSEAALNFISENKNRPFFLYYASPLPHVSLQITDEMLAQYQGKWPEKPHPETGHGYTGHPTPRAAYAAMISHLDRDVGRITALLKKLNLSHNTLVIFTSDNGATFTGGVDYDFFESVKPLRGLKGSLFEGGIRVPMIASWPGKIPANSTSDLISSFADFLPTVAQLTRQHLSQPVTGQSILPELFGKKMNTAPRLLYWEFPAYGGQQAARYGEWKAIRRNLGKHHQAPIQLYNLKTDVAESKDVAAEHPELVNWFAQQMSEARQPSPIYSFPALDQNKSPKNLTP